jgi:hypothetical protein
MSATPIADMVERMAGEGIAWPLIVVAIRAVESCVRKQSADIADIRRTKDRLRKREVRAKLKQVSEPAKANDVAMSADMFADNADKHCNLKGTSGSRSGIQEVRKENTASVNGRAEKLSRGTRLEPNTQPTKFARRPQAWSERRSDQERVG